MQKLKHYAFLVKGYGFETIKIISIILLILNFVFINIYHPEFRTIGYKISSYSSRLSILFILFWMWYLIYKLLIPSSKISILSEIIRIIIAGPLILGLLYLTIYFFFSSYISGGYDECMEWCVAEDLSNYSECSLSTCDFPI